MKLKEYVMSSLRKLNISVDESQYAFLDTTPELVVAISQSACMNLEEILLGCR